MNPAWFGDSYDVVKRYFCDVIAELGYRIEVDPMPTGEWDAISEAYFRFLGVPPKSAPKSNGTSALFIDPDTGVSAKGGPRHLSYDRIARELERHDLLFAFDQSFSRNRDAGQVMREKLQALAQRGCASMYYDSHARFLFVARNGARIGELGAALVARSMPSARLIVAAD